MEGGIHKSDVSVSSYSSLPSGMLIDHHRRSSTDNSSNSPIKSSSASADNLFETKSSIKFNDEDELKNQIEENFHLTQEVLDLKMRLANAMAQIDAEKHTNRLQAEQISHLCDDNDELKCYLDQAYERIAKLERGDGNDDDINRHTDANLHQEASCARPNEGWLRRVASTMSLANNSTSSSTNVCADPQAQRKHAVSPCTTVSTQQSTMTLMERSTRRTSMLSLASSLAEEELPF